MGILLYLAVTVIIAIIILWLGLAIAFFIAGRLVSGVNTTFGEALLVALLGAIINSVLQAIFSFVFTMYFPSVPYADILSFVISSFITLIVYLPLFKRFFDVSWGGAIIVGIIAFIFMIIMGIISAILIVVAAIVLIPLLFLPGP
ncbi:MAG: hypothetical protein ACFE89_05910 [Candidatus Hodarchaeota archaeon]